MSTGPSSFPNLDLGGYRIVGRLGQGAMADVYDAVDSTGHSVALKVFKAGGGMSYTMIERFRREAEATKKLRRHPYILTVYASGHDGDYHYIAMEKVEDSRALDTLARTQPPVDKILGIGVKIASALQYAHERQIIHRDVKPSNILLDEFNEPLLTDFGVAELTDWPSLTLSGALTGTPLYMSPEQARSETCSPASDVYSLAVVLYEALTGHLPYDLPEAPPTPAILDAVKNLAPIPPRNRDKRISRDLNYVLLRALRKNPGERYSSARDFGADLESIIAGRPVAGRWVSPWSRTRFWMRRHRTGLAGAAAFGLFGGVLYLGLRDRLREEAYRGLLLRAVKVSGDLKLAQMSTSNRTEPEMRSARRAMSVGRWIEARDLLQTAANINQDLQQLVPLAEARLELARAELMLHNSRRALDLYAQVWSQEDLSDAVRQIAAFEGILLLSLENRENDALALAASLAVTRDGPYLQLIRHALGEAPPEDWNQITSAWQPRFQWNLTLAEVIRQRNALPRAERVDRIDALLRAESGNSAWPLPFATYLKGRL